MGLDVIMLVCYCVFVCLCLFKLLFCLFGYLVLLFGLFAVCVSFCGAGLIWF